MVNATKAAVVAMALLFLVACGMPQRQEQEAVCDGVVEYTIHRVAGVATDQYEGSAKIGHLVGGTCRERGNYRLRYRTTRFETTGASAFIVRYEIETRVKKYLALYPKPDGASGPNRAVTFPSGSDRRGPSTNGQSSDSCDNEKRA